MIEFTRESQVENLLVYESAKLGGKAYKLSSPSNRAVPDRLCIFPGNLIYFVECKAPGKTWRPLQLRVARFLRKLGCKVLLVDNREPVMQFIQMVKEDMNGQ